MWILHRRSEYWKNSKHPTKLGIKTNGFSIYGLLVSLLGLTLMKFNNRNAHWTNDVKIICSDFENC